MAHQLTRLEGDAVNRFPYAAEQFCQLLENQGDLPRKQFVDNLLAHLSNLLFIGAHLPDVSPTTGGADFLNEDVERHSKECAQLSNILKIKLGNLDAYWSVFDPTEPQKSAPNSLSQDLAEICMDLRDAIELAKSGEPTADVYWQWRFDFREHWARHAVEALKVVLFISRMA
jgi:Domain of unknown function (DUF5063)